MFKMGLKKLLNMKMKVSREGDRELLKNLPKLKLRTSKGKSWRAIYCRIT